MLYIDIVLQGVEADEITSVARQEEDVTFYMTSDVNVAAMFGLDKESKPALVLLKNVPDKRLVFSKYEEIKIITFGLLVHGRCWPIVSH